MVGEQVHSELLDRVVALLLVFQQGRAEVLPLFAQLDTVAALGLVFQRGKVVGLVLFGRLGMVEGPLLSE